MGILAREFSARALTFRRGHWKVVFYALGPKKEIQMKRTLFMALWISTSVLLAVGCGKTEGGGAGKK